jgi:hypothetical protein
MLGSADGHLFHFFHTAGYREKTDRNEWPSPWRSPGTAGKSGDKQATV